MALKDIRLLYRNNKLWTDKDVELAGALTVQGFAVSQPDSLQPVDNGFAAWNYHPATVATTGGLLTNGSIYLNKVPFRSLKTSVTKVWWLQGTAGATPVTGQNFAALVGPDGTVLSSVNIDATVTASNGPKSATLDTPQSNLAAGNYYVALLYNAATVPVIYRASAPFAANATINQSAAQQNHAINGTAATVLPASFTLASNTAGQALWVGVS